MVNKYKVTPLKGKINLSFFILVVTIICVINLVTLGAYFELRKRYEKKTWSEIREYADNFKGYIHYRLTEQNLEKNDIIGQVNYLNDLGKNFFDINLLCESDNKIIMAGGKTPLFDFQKNKGKIYLEARGDDEYFVLNIPVEGNDGNYYLQFIEKNHYLRSHLSIVLLCLIIISIIIILATFIVKNIIYKIIAKPIENLEGLAKKINNFELDKRIEVDDKEEVIGRLAITINSMVERISETFKGQEEFISNVSHELKTPLAVINGYADLILLANGQKTENKENKENKKDKEILERSISEIKNEVKYMNKLTGALLDIATARNEVASHGLETIDLKDLTCQIIEKQRLLHKKHNYNIFLSKKLMVEGSAALIKTVFSELLKNATKHTKAGNNITVIGFATPKHVKMIIEDTGSGIDPRDLENIFTRFYRANENSDSSYGMGLAIIKNILDYHNAKVKIDSELGVGTKFTIIFNRYLAKK